MKRKPKYLKILDGMNHCYGYAGRDCSACPYDKYNDRDMYGQGTSYCMERLNADARKWLGSLGTFTTCADCICFRKDRDENNTFRMTDEKTVDGYCSTWSCMMFETEFCSRGAVRDD